MITIVKLISRFGLLAFSVFLLTVKVPAQSGGVTIVEKHGQLSVQGRFIVDQNNDPVTLRGMSLFWSQWIGKYYNSDCINWLQEDWGCTVIRAALGIGRGGYLEHQEVEMGKVKTVIDACIDAGIYVIVDWHDHVAQWHQEESIQFFTEIATQYGGYPNIIYEIYNEPMQISWADSVKPYSEAVISAIRAIDPDNIILVGNPTWSQDVDIAADDPLEFDNIAYSLHFYAATHKQFLRNKAQAALVKGVALFVSEFGTCESTGDGPIDYHEVELWFEFMEENKISWCNWSIADKVETASALKPGASQTGSWDENQLTESGALIRNKILELNTATGINSTEEEQGIIKLNSIQNYPNPFNSSTKINIFVKETSPIKLDIYNMHGEKIMNVFDDILAKGEHTVSFNSTDLPSGNYLVSYRTGDESNVLKIQLMK